MKNVLRTRIRAPRGEIVPDLIVKINVFTHEILVTDVAIYDGIIVGTGSYEGGKYLDARGQYICQGFIDGHFHMESTMLSAPELAKAVLPHGTTTIVTDPHEIANVMGRRGIHYIIESSRGIPVDFYIMLPLCVPATRLEKSGASLSLEDLMTLKGEDRGLGPAQMMN